MLTWLTTHIDWQWHIGDLVLTLMCSWGLFGLRKIYNALVNFPLRLDNVEEVVDEHSVLLSKLSGKSSVFRKLSHKRRTEDKIEYIGG